MQLDNAKLLNLLGVRAKNDTYGCPIHNKDAFTLKIIQGNNHIAYFACRAPRCNFYGDAISLIARIFNCDIATAIAYLKPGGKLEDCVIIPFSEPEIAAYVNTNANQVSVKAYLTQCQAALRNTPEQAQFRTGVSYSTLNIIPTEVGIITDGHNIPPDFKKYTNGKQVTPHITYPYTFNHNVMSVNVQAANSLFTSDNVTIIRNDLGVFMEPVKQARPYVLIAPSPRAAAIIYGNCTIMGTLAPTIIAAAGYPLPETFYNAKTIILISTLDHPLSIEDAIKILASDNIVSGEKTQPIVRVWRIGHSADKVTGEDVLRRVNRARVLPSLHTWVVLQLIEHAVKGTLDKVKGLLHRYSIPKAARDILRDHATERSAPREVIQLLEQDTKTPYGSAILGNDRVIRWTSRGLEGVTYGGDPVLLCNMNISVNRKIRTYDDKNILVLNVASCDNSVPAIKVNIVDNCSHKAKKIQNALLTAYSELGYSPYIACYDVRFYAWSDILCKLAANCITYTEVDKLGADAAGDIHLPNTVIRSKTNVIEPQQQIFTLPERVMTMYAAIEPSETTAAGEAYSKLLRNCDNLYVAAFTHGLLHIVAQITAGLISRKPYHDVRNILYVETEAHIWETVFKQLASIFSTTRKLSVISPYDPIKYLDKYSSLGDLPWIGRVPVLRGHKMSRLLLDSPVSVCGIIDSATAALGIGALGTTYITPAVTVPERISMLDDDDLNELRMCFASFMIEFINKANLTSMFATNDIPSLAVYRELCRVLNIPATDVMSQIVRKTFPSVGMNGANTFFDILHRYISLTELKPKICVVNGSIGPDKLFTSRGQHIFVMPDVVVISKAVVAIVNNDLTLPMRFDTQALTAELKERNLLQACPQGLAIDENRCWILSRTDWDVKVIRQVTFNRVAFQPNVIKLDQSGSRAG